MIRLGPEWSEHLDRYDRRHAGGADRLFQQIGIPLIALAVPASLIGIRLGVVGIVLLAGWLCQSAGDVAAGRRPSLLDSPRNLFIGPIWWLESCGVPVRRTRKVEVDAGEDS